MESPGFAVAYSESNDTLVAATEKGRLVLWNKPTILGIRTGDTARRN